mmetsp:Transcript_35475/g.102005  ORF Transcript_35475/g.102005 Transcript_35475/m.102005 type:complete len:212 (-) Transcript_35475:589-1224(-)
MHAVLLGQHHHGPLHRTRRLRRKPLEQGHGKPSFLRSAAADDRPKLAMVSEQRHMACLLGRCEGAERFRLQGLGCLIQDHLPNLGRPVLPERLQQCVAADGDAGSEDDVGVAQLRCAGAVVRLEVLTTERVKLWILGTGMAEALEGLPGPNRFLARIVIASGSVATPVQRKTPHFLGYGKRLEGLYVLVIYPPWHRKLPPLNVRTVHPHQA